MTNRAALAVVAIAVAALAAIVTAVLRQGEAGPPLPARPTEATPTPAKPTATQTPSPAPYRLAGVAVAPEGFAVIESPDGTSQLYRVGQLVPGLGRLEQVGPGWATFATAGGRTTTLHVRPAAAPTPTPAPAIDLRGLVREFATPERERRRAGKPTPAEPPASRHPAATAPWVPLPARTVPPPPASGASGRSAS